MRRDRLSKWSEDSDVNLLDKYKNMSKPVKASLWFVASNVILKGISFITLPIFSRLLSTSEYGVVSVYSSWVLLISIITTLTIWGGVFNVGMVKHSNDRETIISSFQGLACTITLAFLVISALCIDALSQMMGMSKFLVICMYIEILAQIPFNLWSSKQRYDYKYKAIIVVTTLTAILNPLIGVIAVLNTQYKAEAKIITNMLIQLVIGIITFVINQKEGNKFFHKEYWKFAFLFNIVLVPHYLSMQVLSQSDRLMINSMCGSSDAGIYSVAYNFAMLLQLVTSGINSSLTPHIYDSIKKNDTKNLGNQVTGITLIVALITLGLICVVPDVFKWMLPESYYEALWVISPVTAGAFFMFLYPLFGSIEFYYEENRYVTAASLIGAGVNILLNYIFINIWGFIAAAYTTLVCYIFFSLCHYFFMKRTLRKRNINIKIYDVKSLFIISAVVIIVSIGIVPLYEQYVIRWGLIALILVGVIIKREKLIKTIKKLFAKS